MKFQAITKMGIGAAALALAACGSSTQDAAEPVLMSKDGSSAALALAPGRTVQELAGGSRTVNLNVVRTGALQDWVAVRYATRSVTATEGTDYRAASGELIFEPYQEEQTIALEILNDSVPEEDEVFVLELTDPTGAMLAFDKAVVTIQDSDIRMPYGTAMFTVINGGTYEYYGVGQNFLQFTVVRSGDLRSTAAVEYQTQDGSATAPADYADASGTLVFHPGKSLRQIRVNVRNDGILEPPEMMTLNLFNAVGGSVMVASATGMILDDSPRLDVQDVQATVQAPNQYCERVIKFEGEPNVHCMVVTCVTGEPMSWTSCPGSAQIAGILESMK